MAKHKDKDLELQNKELKKENLRLQKKILKLEVQIISLTHRDSEIRKLAEPRPLGMKESELKRMIGMWTAQPTKQLTDEKPAA